MELTVNQTVHGFRVTNIRTLTDVKGIMYEMVHEQTGAELVWLKRDEENKTFCIGFKTTPEDDTGVFHICEHSVLNGSRKYPVREPFVDLLKSSLQTFLNAMTFPDKTIYPVSSRNDKDFMNLMDVYLDAVLHPLIYTNPNIFYQEGWHYEIRDEKDDPVYKGVVFNEMKGAFGSVDECILNEVNRILFPDNCYKYVSGGDPDKITDLTYEMFRKAHSTYYHPSNSRVFLDGDMDIDAVLKKINDEYFSAYEKEEMNFVIPMQEPSAAQEREAFYEIGEDEDLKDKAYVVMARIECTWKDPGTIMAWQALSGVLTGTNESPLKKAILEKGLGQDVELAVMDEIQQPYLLCIVRNTEPEKKDEILKTIRNTVRNLVENGLNHDELKASLNQMEFHYREQKEPAGVMMAMIAYRSWLYDGDPALYLSCGEEFSRLRQKADEGYFENLLKEGLLDEEYMNVLTMKPSRELAAKRREKEAAKLKAARESWKDSVSDYIELNRKLDIWQAEEDTPEQKASLPVLQLSDVSREPRPFEPEVRNIHGVPVLVYTASGTGIVYINLYFNLAGLTRDRLPSVSLYADLLTRLRTKKHTLPKLQELIKANLGTLVFGTDAYSADSRNEACIPVLSAYCSVLEQNIDTAVELILEILQETVFEKETILPVVQQHVESSRQMLINAGHSAAAVRAGAHFSAESLAREYMIGYEAARWVTDFKNNYDSRIEQFIDDALTYQEVLSASSRLTMSFTDEKHLEKMTDLIDRLETAVFERGAVRYPLLENKKEGILIPSQVSYSALAGNLRMYGGDYSGSLRVAGQILTYGYLWNEVRVKGGAYGTGFSASPNGSISCYSYRDPTPGRTIQTDRQCAEFIKELAESTSDLTSYIIGTIAKAEPLMTPGQKVRAADGRYFLGIGYEDRKKTRSQILSTTPEDLKNLYSVMKQTLDEGAVVIVGNQEAMDSAEGLTVYKLSGE